MNYVICLKQVPDTKEIKQDEKTGSLLRDSAGSMPNPDDHSALEACLLAREKTNGKIKAITMGPKQSRASLRNALSLGVDEAYHMRDKFFSGADVLATVHALFQGIKKIGLPDMVFCGTQSSDGDTGQVGAELAEVLGYSHVYYVSEIIDINKEEVTLKSKMGDYTDTIKVKLPAVLSINSESYLPRRSSFRDKMLSQKKQIDILELKDLKDTNKDNYGYPGSATRVKSMFVPKITRQSEMLSGSTCKNTDFILEKFKEWEELI